MCESQRALAGSGSRVAQVPKGPRLAAAPGLSDTRTPALTPPKAPHVLPPSAPVSAVPVAAVRGDARAQVVNALAPALPQVGGTLPVAAGKPVADLPKFAPAVVTAKPASGPVAPPEKSIDPSMVKGLQAVLARMEVALAEKSSKAANLDYLRSAITNIAQASRQPVPTLLPNLAAHQKALAQLIQPYLPPDGKFKLVRRAAGLEK